MRTSPHKREYTELLYKTSGWLLGIAIAIIIASTLTSCKKKDPIPEPEPIVQQPIIHYGDLSLEMYKKCSTSPQTKLSPVTVFLYKSISDRDNGIAFRKEVMSTYFDTIINIESRNEDYYGILEYYSCSSGISKRLISFKIQNSTVTAKSYTVN